MDRPLPDGCGRCRHWSTQRPGAGRPAPAMRLADDANPLAGMPFYVNPISAAMRAAQHADPPSPELTAVANTPQAYWIVPGSSASTVAKYTGDAAAAGALPVFTIYGIPHRDCGSFAAGGMGSGRRLSRVDRHHRIPTWARHGLAIIVEPDALAMADCLSGDQRQERYDLIHYAVDTLTRNPAAAVYVDGGHVRWHSAGDMADRLNKAGVGSRAGFQPQRRELLHHRGRNRLWRGHFGAHQRFALRDRHIAQRRRTSARLQARLVQPRRPSTGHSAHHGDGNGAHATLSCGSSVPVNPTERAAKVTHRPAPS